MSNPKIVDASDVVWAELYDVSDRGDWLVARWLPISLPSEVRQLLETYEKYVNIQYFPGVAIRDEVIETMEIYLLWNDGRRLRIHEIQKNEDMISLKLESP